MLTADVAALIHRTLVTIPCYRRVVRGPVIDIQPSFPGQKSYMTFEWSPSRPRGKADEHAGEFPSEGDDDERRAFRPVPLM